LKSSLLADHKNKFKENWADFNQNKKLSMNRNYELFSSTHTFEHFGFLNPFLDYNGIDYLTLILIYLIELPFNEVLWDHL
jgi:hypothetical protein